jgi:hypothetical protein
MKKLAIFFIIGFIFLSNGLNAQKEKPFRLHQIGINFSSLNSFGIHYKTGSEKILLRISMLSLNLEQNANRGRADDSLEIKQQMYGAGFRIGFEKRVQIIPKLDFIWGLEAGVNYTYQKQERDDPNYYLNYFEQKDWRITTMADLILGISYTISDHLVLGAEITPGIQYSYGITKTTSDTKTVEQTNTGFGFNFSNSPASLSVAYRFGK